MRGGGLCPFSQIVIILFCFVFQLSYILMELIHTFGAFLEYSAQFHYIPNFCSSLCKKGLRTLEHLPQIPELSNDLNTSFIRDEHPGYGLHWFDRATSQRHTWHLFVEGIAIALT
jgi:hypothetical protein